MTPFWAFVIGTFFSGILLTLVFCVFVLEVARKAYWKGYSDGFMEVDDETYI